MHSITHTIKARSNPVVECSRSILDQSICKYQIHDHLRLISKGKLPTGSLAECGMNPPGQIMLRVFYDVCSKSMAASISNATDRLKDLVMNIVLRDIGGTESLCFNRNGCKWVLEGAGSSRFTTGLKE